VRPQKKSLRVLTQHLLSLMVNLALVQSLTMVWSLRRSLQLSLQQWALSPWLALSLAPSFGVQQW
jgi:hypothetical protein